MSNFDTLDEKLTRIETRVVRGFNELGVDVTHSTQKPVCFPEEGRLVLQSLDVSVAVLFRTALDNQMDKHYSLVTVEYDGRHILSLNLTR